MKNKFYKIIAGVLLFIIGLLLFIIIKRNVHNTESTFANYANIRRLDAMVITNRSDIPSDVEIPKSEKPFKTLSCINNVVNVGQAISNDKKISASIDIICEYNKKTKEVSEKWGLQLEDINNSYIISDLPSIGTPKIIALTDTFAVITFCYERCSGPILVTFDWKIKKIKDISKLLENEALVKYQLHDAVTEVIQNKLLLIAPRHILELNPRTLEAKVLVEVKENEMIGQESALPAFMPEYAVLKERIYYSVYADGNRYDDQTSNAKREYIKYIEIQ